METRTLPSKDAVLQRASRLFWERPFAPGDLDAYPRWVVSRVIHYGEEFFVREVRRLVLP